MTITLAKVLSVKSKEQTFNKKGNNRASLITAGKQIPGVLHTQELTSPNWDCRMKRLCFSAHIVLLFKAFNLFQSPFNKQFSSNNPSKLLTLTHYLYSVLCTGSPAACLRGLETLGKVHFRTTNTFWRTQRKPPSMKRTCNHLEHRLKGGTETYDVK